MFNVLLTIAAICGVFALTALFADRPNIERWLTSWNERLLAEEQWYAEAHTQGWGRSYAAWHEMEGYSKLRDWVTWQLFKHRQGRFLVRAYAFSAIDRLVRPVHTMRSVGAYLLGAWQFRLTTSCTHRYDNDDMLWWSYCAGRHRIHKVTRGRYYGTHMEAIDPQRFTTALRGR